MVDFSVRLLLLQAGRNQMGDGIKGTVLVLCSGKSLFSDVSQQNSTTCGLLCTKRRWVLL